MGRKKSYDPTEVLDRLTHVFWQRGYNATSITDLEAATGVNRKSLLTEFSSKQEMFLRSLAHYLDIKAKPDGAALFRPPLGPRNIHEFFKRIRYKEDEWGCLLALTILEKESVPEEAHAMARSTYRGLEEAFFANLLPAVEDGRLADRKAARGLARFLLNTLHGIVINGRAGATNAELKSIIAVALASVPRH